MVYALSFYGTYKNTQENKGCHCYKNCNLGNIEKSNDKFQGEVISSQDKRFKRFQSMPYGYRAIFITLAIYRKHGRDTIEKIITAWSPPVEH